MSKDLQAYLGKSQDAPQLTAKDICKIIEIARLQGVHSLSVGELKVDFFQPDKTCTPCESSESQPGPLDTPLAKPMPEKHTKEEQQRMLLEANVLAREAELEQPQILEPDKYEELIAQGELVDGPGKTEQDSFD